MKRNAKEATLTIDDLRKLILHRPPDQNTDDPREALDPDESSVIGGYFTHYALACVVGIVVAMLVISIVS